MIIGDKGPLSEAQATKQQQDVDERKRIATLSNKNIVGEIRKGMKVDHLSSVIGAALLTWIRADAEDRRSPSRQIRLGNDPYCLSYSGRRPKMGRTRKGKIAAPKS